jgi:hypothetical protein
VRRRSWCGRAVKLSAHVVRALGALECDVGQTFQTEDAALRQLEAGAENDNRPIVSIAIGPQN